MKNEILDVQYLPYLSSDFDKWKNKDFSFIPDNVTDLDRSRVQEKASIRNNRYFGECIVLREFSDKFIKSRYSHSYQWLYRDSWCLNEPSGKLQNEFYHDLFDYFPENKVQKAQSQAREYIKKYGIKPSSPDVWLIAEYPNSWFIEVKKLNEERRKGQLEGLAIIAKYLKCKVSIYRLYSETEEPQSRLVDSNKKEFQEIYQSLNGF
jgi:hypothetical protein